MKQAYFTSSPEQIKRWKAWCDLLMKMEDEARRTLVEENVAYEACYLLDEYVMFEAEIEEGKEQKPSTDRPINIVHRMMIEQCLKRTEEPPRVFKKKELLYRFSV